MSQHNTRCPVLGCGRWSHRCSAGLALSLLTSAFSSTRPSMLSSTVTCAQRAMRVTLDA